MTVRVVYRDGAPSFPASDQHPDAVRYTVGAYVVDAIGPKPSLEEVEAVLADTQPSAKDKIRDLISKGDLAGAMHKFLELNP